MNTATDTERAPANYFVPIVTLIVILGAAWLGEPGRLLLRFDRDAIAAGELWRFVTGNLVHLSWGHTLMNAVGFVFISILFARQFTKAAWFIVLVTSSLSVTLGLWYLEPGLDWYVGLSGTLHGVLVAGLIQSLRRGYRLEGLLLAALIAKLAWEHFSGPLPGSSELAGGPVIVNAHLYGAVGGLLFALFSKIRDDVRGRY